MTVLAGQRGTDGRVELELLVNVVLHDVLRANLCIGLLALQCLFQPSLQQVGGLDARLCVVGVGFYRFRQISYFSRCLVQLSFCLGQLLLCLSVAASILTAHKLEVGNT